MTATEKERHERLCAALKRCELSLKHVKGDWWPQWEYLPHYKDWDPLVPELYEECEAGGGTITDLYVDGLVNITTHAIPAINEVEMVGRVNSGV